MKILQKSTLKHVYRLRCISCKSVIEMDDEERREWDLKYDEGCHRNSLTLEEKRNDPTYYAHNPMGYFDCPVCNKRSYATRGETHRYTVMEDGTEYRDY